jgi:hypothetical protein
MNVEIGRQNIIILFWKEPAQFHFWENLYRNQTFLLDSHRPFFYSVGLTTPRERGAQKISKILRNLSAGIFRTTKVFDLASMQYIFFVDYSPKMTCKALIRTKAWE